MNAATTTVSVQNPTPPDIHGDTIGIRGASFTWARDSALSAANSAKSRRAFALRIEDEVIFQPGKLNLIVGPTGAGKTSMLMALLGEMHYTPLGADSWVNLPKKDGVAYASQESWVLSETIKVSPKRVLYIMHMIHPHLHRKIFCSERHSTRNVTRKV